MFSSPYHCLSISGSSLHFYQRTNQVLHLCAPSAEVIFLYLELCSSYMASTPVLPKSASFIEFIHVYNLGLAPEEIRVQIKACSPFSHMKSTLLVNFCFPWSYLFLLILYLFHLFFCIFLIN